MNMIKGFLACIILAISLLVYITLKSTLILYKDTGVVSVKVVQVDVIPRVEERGSVISNGSFACPVRSQNRVDDYIVYVLYNNKKYIIDDKDLYDIATVGSEIKVHVYKRKDKIRLVYKGDE